MLYIAACGNEASVRKYLKEMEGEYVREDVQILCGDEIEGSGTMPDVLFLSDSGVGGVPERDSSMVPQKSV